MTLEETARGARNRADAACRAHARPPGGPSRGGLPHLGVGIESGYLSSMAGTLTCASCRRTTVPRTTSG